MAENRFDSGGRHATAGACALPLADSGPKGTCTHRDPGDDFFCLRYRVWYASLDCAHRTRHRTAPGCLRCDQGRFNLKRHADRLR